MIMKTFSWYVRHPRFTLLSWAMVSLDIIIIFSVMYLVPIIHPTVLPISVEIDFLRPGLSPDQVKRVTHYTIQQKFHFPCL